MPSMAVRRMTAAMPSRSAEWVPPASPVTMKRSSRRWCSAIVGVDASGRVTRRASVAARESTQRRYSDAPKRAMKSRLLGRLFLRLLDLLRRFLRGILLLHGHDLAVQRVDVHF